MLHYCFGDNDEHYAVNHDASSGRVLVQLQDKEGTQVRVALPPAEADHLITLLKDALEVVLASKEE